MIRKQRILNATNGPMAKGKGHESPGTGLYPTFKQLYPRTKSLSPPTMKALHQDLSINIWNCCRTFLHYLSRTPISGDIELYVIALTVSRANSFQATKMGLWKYGRNLLKSGQLERHVPKKRKTDVPAPPQCHQAFCLTSTAVWILHRKQTSQTDAFSPGISIFAKRHQSRSPQ